MKKNEPIDTTYFERYLSSFPENASSQYLAFYDHRIGLITKDPRFFVIPLDDHICHRGDGLFESICFRKRTIFALDAHLARMQDGAKALSIQPPCSWSAIRKQVCAVAKAAQSEDGDLRLFLSRGPGGFGVSPSECPCAGLYIVALKAKPVDEKFFENGVSAFTSKIPPKQEYLVTIKNTNYLPNVFMAQEAESKGMDVAVSFDASGIMGEAAVANLAIVSKDGIFISPEFTRILPGTTLLAALDIVSKKMPVQKKGITHDDIFSAKEVLLLTSSKLCVAVTSFDGKQIGDATHLGKPGSVARMLRKELFDLYLQNGTPI